MYTSDGAWKIKEKENYLNNELDLVLSFKWNWNICQFYSRKLLNKGLFEIIAINEIEIFVNSTAENYETKAYLKLLKLLQ